MQNSWALYLLRGCLPTTTIWLDHLGTLVLRVSTILYEQHGTVAKKQDKHQNTKNLSNNDQYVSLTNIYREVLTKGRMELMLGTFKAE